jgi:hypothetical protein
MLLFLGKDSSSKKNAMLKDLASEVTVFLLIVILSNDMTNCLHSVCNSHNTLTSLVLRIEVFQPPMSNLEPIDLQTRKDLFLVVSWGKETVSLVLSNTFLVIFV